MAVGEEGTWLEFTPTRVVAALCAVIVGISIAVERLLHFTGNVFDAVGFISLLLAVFQSKIVKIYVKKSNGPPSAATSHLRHLLAKEATTMGYCASNGDGIEECRKLCGGHGYLVSSGLPELFVVYIPACT
ncbi:hypothetical protein L2E82_10529 [Cichorium intybus]|uniref:Uncharacterized protein n=1 Tax=Cichorium intybus TaxID=13427 RepID=A0ACB9GBX6_CICIN|nr:hypothetical protein L2E82_10529 [Cichorium intybus]